MWFIGRKSKVDFAIFAYGFLVKTFNRLWREYKAESYADSSERASFFHGLWVGLYNKLEKAESKLVTESAKELTELGASNASSELTLAVVKEKDAITQARDEFHPVLVERKTNYGANVDRYSHAHFHGIDKGRSIDILTPLEQSNSDKLQ
jgi:hypothetical protein